MDVEKNLEVDIEKLKAKVEVLIKIKEEMNNRISFLNEKIGEMRSSLVDKEKELTELKSNIEKTIQIVSELKPEEILRKFNEFYAKIEIINARIESNETILNKIIEELKEIRRIYLKFKSFEEIKKIEEDVKKDLGEIKKSESKIFSTSTKIESIFLEMNKRFEEFLELKKEVEKFKENLKEIIQEVNNLKVLSTSFIRKEEILELKELVKNVKSYEETLRSKIESIQSLENISKFEELLRRVKEENQLIMEKTKILEEIILKQRNLEEKINRLDIASKNFVGKPEMEQLKTKIEKYLLEADKVRKDFEEKLKEIKQIEAQGLDKRVFELERKYDEIKILEEKINRLDIASKNFVGKPEMEQLKTKIEKYLLEADKVRKDFEDKLKEIKQIEAQGLDKRVFELEKKYDEINKNIIKIIDILKIFADAYREYKRELESVKSETGSFLKTTKVKKVLPWQ